MMEYMFFFLLQSPHSIENPILGPEETSGEKASLQLQLTD